jgi:hypothetical protein
MHPALTERIKKQPKEAARRDSFLGRRDKSAHRTNLSDCPLIDDTLLLRIHHSPRLNMYNCGHQPLAIMCYGLATAKLKFLFIEGSIAIASFGKKNNPFFKPQIR